MGAPARAQRPDTPVVGCLGSEAPDSYASHLVAFRDGLAEAGYAEGRNVAIESRWAGGQYRRLPALAEDLVGRRLSVIVALGGAEMAPRWRRRRRRPPRRPRRPRRGGRPVATGGQHHGRVELEQGTSRKRLEFMHELLPDAGVFAVAAGIPVQGAMTAPGQRAATDG